MAEILKLRGGPALSAFRLEKLHARLGEIAPGARIAGAEFWHFVETAHALDARERAVLEQLLVYGEPAPPAGASLAGAAARGSFVSGGAAPGHDFALVVQGHRHRAPVRPAGGAAHRARHRLLRRRQRRPQAGDRGLAPRSHDRDRARQPGSGRTAVPPCRAAAARIDRYFCARPRGAGGGQPRHGPRLVRRRDRLSAGKFSRHRPQSHRCRTHHVRAGELRALPPQDLQCLLGDRRQGRGAYAVRHDPRDGKGQPAGHGARLFGQLRHHGRARNRALLPRCGRGLRLSPRDHAHPDEGGDAQPSNRDFAFSGRCHGLRRRDPRRGGDRPRSQAQSRSCGFFGVESAHSGLGAAMGSGARQARAHCLGPGHHARRTDRRRGVQQRVRPAQPRRLLPQLRDRGRRRAARLSQADHDRGRRRQYRRARRIQTRTARRIAADPARRPGHADRHGRRRRIEHGHRQPTPRTWTSIRCSAATPKSSAARRKSSTAAGNWAKAIPSCRSTTSARAGCRTRCPNSRTAPAAAPSWICARCRAKSRACRRARSGATRRRSATCLPSRRPSSKRFAPSAHASAVRSPCSASRPRSSSSRSPMRAMATSRWTWTSACCWASRRACCARSHAARARCRRSRPRASSCPMPAFACCAIPRWPTRPSSSASATAPWAGCARAILSSDRGRRRWPIAP